MSGEQIAGALTMATLGVGLLTVGWLARRGRLELTLGGWTNDTTSPSSWGAAHQVIGTWLAIAGGIATASAIGAVASPAELVGRWVVAGSIALLAPVVVGVVRGVSRLEPGGSPEA